MPKELTAAGRIPLWHALFELHNGRIFQDWIGAAHWLVVPLGSTAAGHRHRQHRLAQREHMRPTPIQRHQWNALLFHVFDPEGHRIELWQPLA
jgi:hypothetical protein